MNAARDRPLLGCRDRSLRRAVLDQRPILALKRGAMPCSAALSAIASSRRRFDSVRRRPSLRGRKSTPVIPSSRLRAISFRSISSIVIVFTGDHTFKYAQVHRPRRFGLDPAIKVGTVDIRSKRPRQARLIQQRPASCRVRLVLV